MKLMVVDDKDNEDDEHDDVDACVFADLKSGGR